MNKVITGVLSIVAAGIVFLIYALSSSTTEMPVEPKADQVETAASGIGIYIDASMSMRGYFSHKPNPGTLVQRFMWSWMQPELMAVQPESGISLSRFGTGMAEQKPLGDSLHRLFSFGSRNERDAFFFDTQTNLIEQLQRDELLSFDAFLVLTDGVQSTPELAGPDPRLIPAIRENIIQPGMHLWLIGVRTQFTGMVYPEIPGPTGKQAFHYSGLRPIYMWIGSRSLEAGREVVARFIRRLRDLAAETGGQDPRDAVRVAEFTEHEIPECSPLLDGAALKNLIIRDHGEIIEITYSRHTNGPLTIPIDTNCTENMIDTRVMFTFSSTNPMVEITRQEGRWYLTVYPGQVSMFDLALHARIDMEPWWEEWGTDNDSRKDNAGRTLYMQNVAGELMAPAVEATLAELSVEIN